MLLAAAMAEEKEAGKRPKRRSSRVKKVAEVKGGLVVFCPLGHRIHVQERHAGRIGKCPQCKNLFFVPKLAPGDATADAEQTVAATAASASGAYSGWIVELKLHTVNPTKLKLKPGSLLNEFETADVAGSATDLLIATVFKAEGMFGGNEKVKKPATRQALFEYLAADKPAAQAPVSRAVVVGAEEAGQLKIVQPADPNEESIFASVPVFGEGRIAVRLPGIVEPGSRLYLSFGLSEFREFSQLLEKTFGVTNYGGELDIPLVDHFTEHKCHYSDSVLLALDDLTWYKADPKLKTKLLGYKCAGCGLVVSEDSRKKEKIGGKTGSGIAKAVCPKCKKKFGNLPLYGLDAPVTPSMAEATT